MLFYLHRVCFAWRCLAVGKYRPIVTFQNICTHWGNNGVELQELVGEWGGGGVWWGVGRRCHTSHLSRSSEPQRCRTAPESCWTERRGRSSTAYPAATEGGRRRLAFENRGRLTHTHTHKWAAGSVSNCLTKKKKHLVRALQKRRTCDITDVRHGKTWNIKQHLPTRALFPL